MNYIEKVASLKNKYDLDHKNFIFLPKLPYLSNDLSISINTSKKRTFYKVSSIYYKCLLYMYRYIKKSINATIIVCMYISWYIPTLFSWIHRCVKKDVQHKFACIPLINVLANIIS